MGKAQENSPGVFAAPCLVTEHRFLYPAEETTGEALLYSAKLKPPDTIDAAVQAKSILIMFCPQSDLDAIDVEWFGLGIPQ